MLRIRLARKGRKHVPHYHIVVIPQQNKRDGIHIEKIGFYAPLKSEINEKYYLNVERYRHWLSLGAQPSLIVTKILKIVTEK